MNTKIINHRRTFYFDSLEEEKQFEQKNINFFEKTFAFNNTTYKYIRMRIEMKLPCKTTIWFCKYN